MQRTGGLSHRNMTSFFQLVSSNKLIAALLTVYLISLLYGSMLASGGTNTLKENLMALSGEYLSSRQSQSILSAFFMSFSSMGLYLLISFFSGFFAIGQPVCFAVALFRGFGLGLSMGNIYINYHLSGILYSFLTIVPIATFFLFLMLSALKDSIQMSMLFLSSAFPKIKGEMSNQKFALYCRKYLVYFAIAAVISFLDAVGSFLFSGLVPVS